jgi:phospholipid/cholesterol/gamma-HCH transport system substrate-binding protein
MLMLQLKRNWGAMLAIVALIVVSVIAGAYILSEQHLRTPFQDRYTMNAELENAQGLTPGLNQPVNVAGVRIGDVVGVTLRNGRAVVKLSIDPHKLPHVYANASAVMVPNTGAKDMQIDLTPGHAPAPVMKHGAMIGVARSSVPLNSDDLTDALDTDTRAWLDSLVHGLGQGTAGRTQDVRGLIRALGPTATETRQLGDALAARRRSIARLVHNLRVLTSAAAAKDSQLGQVVDASDATLSAVAGQDAALRQSIAQLPGTLSKARTTLGDAAQFAKGLAPTISSLVPGGLGPTPSTKSDAAKKILAAVRSTGTLVSTAEPIVRTQARPLVRALRPLADDLSPALTDLSDQTPYLSGAFQVVNYVLNELAYNPPGSNEGFLYWLDWFSHDVNSFLSTEDANGAVWRGLAVVSCSTLDRDPTLGTLLQPIFGALPICPKAP